VSSQPTPGKLSPDLLQALHGIKSVRLFPKGAKLFQQGVVATGVYLVESGEARVRPVRAKSSFWRLSVLERCSD
jgi:CRP-like cAMP-binding protein